MASHVYVGCECYVARHDSIPRLLEGHRRGRRPLSRRRDRDARERSARWRHQPATGVRLAPWCRADPRDPREPGERRRHGRGGSCRGARGPLAMAMRERAMRDVTLDELSADLAAFPEVAPFATTPREIMCRQGCHEYPARQLAF